jgi:hypothetical protein
MEELLNPGGLFSWELVNDRVFDYTSMDDIRRGRIWYNTFLLGISPDNGFKKFEEMLGTALIVICSPPIFKYLYEGNLLLWVGDNPATLLQYEIFHVAIRKGIDHLADMFVHVDEKYEKCLVDLSQYLTSVNFAHPWEGGDGVRSPQFKLARLLAKLSKNILFLGPSALHHKINNDGDMIIRWMTPLSKDTAKAALGPTFKLQAKPKVRTSMFLCEVLLNAWISVRSKLKPVLTELASQNRIDAAALLYMLEVTLPLAVLPYNLLCLNNSGSEYYRAQHLLAGDYAVRDRKQYKFSATWAIQQLRHLQKTCPNIARAVFSNPQWQNEANFEGEIMGGVLARNLIKADKDEIAVAKAKHAGLLRRILAFKAMKEAIAVQTSGKGRKHEPDDLCLAGAKAARVLFDLVKKIKASRPPDTTHVKWKKTPVEGEAKVLPASIAIQAFSPDPMKPLFYVVNSIASPAYALSMRWAKNHIYNPMMPESVEHRAANGCQGCTDPAHFASRCIAIDAEEVTALDCGHVFCKGKTIFRQKNEKNFKCWICFMLHCEAGKANMATRNHHFETVDISVATMSKGLKDIADGGAGSDGEEDDEQEVPADGAAQTGADLLATLISDITAFI